VALSCPATPAPVTDRSEVVKPGPEASTAESARMEGRATSSSGWYRLTSGVMIF
jgi:hypothetical protein